MTRLPRLMRSELVQFLMADGSQAAADFALVLIERGQYTEATEDEIEQADKLI